MLYGEPWTAGATPLRKVFDKGQARGTGIAAFNDGFRDAIKGDRDGGAPGFVQTGDRIDGVKDGVTGSIGNWTKDPADAVQYCEAHDNLTTWDKLLQSASHESDELRRQMQCFAGFLVLTAQGVPLLHSGQEFCRTKHGNSNSYNAPDEINRIEWSLKKTHRRVFEYYKSLIAIRKAHPVFRLRTGDDVRRRLAFIDDVAHPKCFAYTLDAKGLHGETWSRAVLLHNGDGEERTLGLPAGSWEIYVDHERASTTALAKATGAVVLQPHSGMILARMTEEEPASDKEA
jgi:pullulanase